MPGAVFCFRCYKRTENKSRRVTQICYNMEMPHKYLSSIDYINSLSFDYWETWSFQRGIGFEQNSETIQYLFNDEGQIHPSGQKMNTFQSINPLTGRLKDILRTAIQDIPSWMCAPIYRDAIVFYSLSGQVVSVLNICLSCEYMQIDQFTHIDADAKTYALLSEFFVNIGHQIEAER
jgi:hypothetical protein